MRHIKCGFAGLGFCLVALSLTTAWAQPPVSTANEYSLRPDVGFRVSSQLHAVASAQSLATLLDQIMQPAVYLLEENAGFARPDPLKYSVLGDSWVWNEHRWDGWANNDPLWAGAPLVDIPFRMLGAITLQSAEAPQALGETGMAMDTVDVGDERRMVIGGSSVVPRLGGPFFAARPIMDLISGSHAVDREVGPIRTRQRLEANGRLWSLSQLGDRRTDVLLGTDVESGRRRFISISAPRDTQYTGIPDSQKAYDDYLLVRQALVMRSHQRPWQLNAAINVDERSLLFRELGFGVAESARYQSVAALLGWRWENWRIGWGGRFADLQARSAESSREIVDADGQALFPWYPSGRYQAQVLSLDGEGSWWFASARHNRLSIMPESSDWIVPLTFEQRPYGSWNLHTEKTVESIGLVRSGVRGTSELGVLRLSGEVYGMATYAGFSARDHSIMGMDVGAAARMQWPMRQRARGFVFSARRPIGYTHEVMRFVDPAYLSAEQYLWDHPASPVDTVGGHYVRSDSWLWPTSANSLGLGSEVDLGRWWQVTALGMAKVYHNPQRLVLDGDPSQFGTTIEGQYYFDPGGVAYRLVNDNSWPWYYGVHLQIRGAKPGVFELVGNLTAYNALGHAPFGIGPIANDIGVVNFAGANPNAEQREFANLDSDRAFLTRILWGQHLVRGLWSWLTLAHRDGSPTTFLQYRQYQEQVAVSYSSYRGSPLQGRPLIGPREDFQLNVDWQVAYQWQQHTQGRVWLMVANLLDFGNEIAEAQTAAGLQYRAALEREIPRALVVGVEWSPQ